MARYIDADKFEKEIKIEASECIASAVIRMVDRQPTADVVEIPCRCRNCKYKDKEFINMSGKHLCNYWDGIIKNEDGFCSYGAKMDGKD